MVLKKSLTLYDRDENGELIPQEVELSLSEEDTKNYPELVGQTIQLIPLTRGELKSIYGLSGNMDVSDGKDLDTDIIVKYCKEPVYTKEELAFAKPVVVRSIVRTILSESGVKFDDETGTKRFEDNDEFGKNSSGLSGKKKKAA